MCVVIGFHFDAVGCVVEHSIVKRSSTIAVLDVNFAVAFADQNPNVRRMLAHDSPV